MRPPANASDNLLISPRKIARDLLILVPLLALAGYGLKQSKWLEPASPGKATAATLPAAVSQAPEGTNPEVLAVLAHLEREDPTIIATVGDFEITQGDLDTRAATLITRLNKPLADNLKADIQAEFLRVQVFYDVSRELAEEEAARQMGVIPSDAEVDARIGEIESGFGSSEAFEQQLSQMRTDREGMRALTRRNLQAEQLRTIVLSDLEIAPESPEADEQYETWLNEQVALMKVQVLDPDFQESMRKLVELFQQAPEHATAPGAGGGMPLGHPPLESPVPSSS